MKKIFIVEDDEGIRELVEFLLTTQDYSVQAFPNARTFQKTVKEQVPDLFLLDIMLPDGNGLDLCKDLKESEETSHIPVVLMSAHANVDRLEGANDFIAKPFDVDELLLRIGKQFA
ncbi:Response regulator receiver domain-containing protein [Salinimicrobium catena]|uniref:Response regulator receiver domain-containing protein n=1 Tax=Salinimicrobium catena TaxID=390640 RepID=A0A1H5HZC1_9FLAO|nr:response regulator [Salinimicrobium catena]SDK73926.1 Response regulator receiver domain-containing protein [Salinimicrobium catena]SEE33413.1 Response regulator receiver domain-containing protein [Salinimicrobium catena]